MTSPSLRGIDAAVFGQTRSGPQQRLLQANGPWLLLLPGLVYLTVFYVLPIVEALRLCFASTESLRTLRDVVESATTWIIFWQTFDMAAVVTAICVLLGYPIAYLLVRLPDTWQRVVVVLVLLPFWISTLVRSYAWISILGRKGVVNWLVLATGLREEPLTLIYNRLGAYIGMVNVVLPIMILVLYAAFSRIDLNLVRVGALLGARPSYVFLRIWLPLSLPGVASGSVLVFLISLGVFTTPAILGGASEMSVTMAIEQQVGILLDLPAAAAISSLLLVVTLTLLFLARRLWVPALLGQSVESGQADGRRRLDGAMTRIAQLVAHRPARRSDRRRATAPATGRYWREERSRGRRALIFVAAIGLAYLLIPVVVVLGLSVSSANFLQFPPQGLSLRWFRTFFASSEWVGSTLRSFIVASLATAIAIVLGTVAALGLERGRMRAREGLYVFFLSPLVVPPTVTAFGLYYVYSRLGWIGSLFALAAAHVAVVLPFVFVTLNQGLRTIDRGIELAASGLGGRPSYVFRRITLPLLKPAIVSGALLAFLTSFDELIIALFLSTPSTSTLPKRMWDSVRFEIDPTNAAAAALLIAFSVVIVVASLALGPSRRNARATTTAP